MLATNLHQLNPLALPSLSTNTTGFSLSSSRKGSKVKVGGAKGPTPLQRVPLLPPLTRAWPREEAPPTAFSHSTTDGVSSKLQRELKGEEASPFTFTPEAEEPNFKFPMWQVAAVPQHSGMGICVHIPDPGYVAQLFDIYQSAMA